MSTERLHYLSHSQVLSTNHVLSVQFEFVFFPDLLNVEVGVGMLDAFSDSLLNVQSYLGLSFHDIAMLLDERPSMEFEVLHFVIENVIFLLFPLLLFLEKHPLLSQPLCSSQLVCCKV